MALGCMVAIKRRRDEPAGNYYMHAELVVACLPIAFVFRPKKGAAGAYVIAIIQSSQAV